VKIKLSRISAMLGHVGKGKALRNLADNVALQNAFSTGCAQLAFAASYTDTDALEKTSFSEALDAATSRTQSNLLQRHRDIIALNELIVGKDGPGTADSGKGAKATLLHWSWGKLRMNKTVVKLALKNLKAGPHLEWCELSSGGARIGITPLAKVRRILLGAQTPATCDGQVCYVTPEWLCFTLILDDMTTLDLQCESVADLCVIVMGVQSVAGAAEGSKLKFGSYFNRDQRWKREPFNRRDIFWLRARCAVMAQARALGISTTEFMCAALENMEQ
jgi:hypothetical protein